MSDCTSTNAPRLFPATHWSVVLAASAGDEADSLRALETLCRAYWYPLYAWLRRQGHSSHDAQDLTQGFFARLLEEHYLDAADRDKGRLRSFLLMALKRFLAKEWERGRAQKRQTSPWISCWGHWREHSSGCSRAWQRMWFHACARGRRVRVRSRKELLTGGAIKAVGREQD